MKKTKLVIVALFAALAVALVTGCQNTASGTNENSGTTQTNLVAGNTYK
ncbi:MAG: lipoprotein, partial [Treponema sp.]|nr:lipoprotein [Treponema sp.]